uniref:Curromycin resistance protein n=1 Tax=Streptomyces hygroscopicus TaxID=1912 RepID=CRE_STRHY|nr:RecName: Full=Curromycin resistance protein [Streptomyces hygroscopicus]AAA26721.1 cre peptide [Streptomyces hygroscopicus]
MSVVALGATSITPPHGPESQGRPFPARGPVRPSARARPVPLWTYGYSEGTSRAGRRWG